MVALSLNQLIGSTQRGAYPLGDRIRSAVSNISNAAESTANGVAGGDSTSVSSQRIQARVSGFREAAQDVAKTLTEIAFAARGVEQMGDDLSELQTLAQAALKAPLDEKTLTKLNKAVQSTRASVDKTVAANAFLAPEVATPEGGADVAATQNEAENTPKISSKSLLGAEKTLTSEIDVRNLITTLQQAKSQLGSLDKDIKQMLESYDSMATHLDVSMENQIAARSTLPQQQELSLLEAVFGNPSQAIFAQSAHLSPSFLGLI
jgi:hypothetical protein